LYWECTHGCKVFFEYPPYGKLIKHKCKKKGNKDRKKIYKNIIKKPKGLLNNPNLHCPACGKVFQNKQSLRDHIKSLKSQDYYHRILISSFDDLDSNDLKVNQTKGESKHKPVFGKVTFKE
jgi:uncharacterized Zn finger protein